jgi:hypothetical protein
MRTSARDGSKDDLDARAETWPSDRSLGVLASSAQDQAASLEAMLNFDTRRKQRLRPPPKPLYRWLLNPRRVGDGTSLPAC